MCGYHFDTPYMKIHNTRFSFTKQIIEDNNLNVSNNHMDNIPYEYTLVLNELYKIKLSVVMTTRQTHFDKLSHDDMRLK